MKIPPSEVERAAAEAGERVAADLRELLWKYDFAPGDSVKTTVTVNITDEGLADEPLIVEEITRAESGVRAGSEPAGR